MFAILLIVFVLAGIAELASLIIIIFSSLKHMPSGLIKHSLGVLKYAAGIWLICLAVLFFFYRDQDPGEVFFHKPDQETQEFQETQGDQDKQENQDKQEDQDKQDHPAGDGDAGSGKNGFSLHVLDVGQGLCILIQADGHYCVYDGGPADTSSKVVAILKNEGITHLDYVIASHYDEDHISGLVGVLNAFDVGKVICPDYETDTRIYRSFMNTAQEKQIPMLHPATGDRYEIGGAEIHVLAPQAYPDKVDTASDTPSDTASGTASDKASDKAPDSASDNDLSICIRILYGSYSCLITGDAEKAEEESMIASGHNLESDTYIAGHHGSATSTSEAFLDAVLPRDVIISCGVNNPYGHPAQEVLQRIYVLGSNILRTDLQGQIDIESDGSTYHITSSEEPVRQIHNYETTYILNTRSHKFHQPDCSAVEEMSDRNKAYTDEDRESLISQGYSPCGICNP